MGSNSEHEDLKLTIAIVRARAHTRARARVCACCRHHKRYVEFGWSILHMLLSSRSLSTCGGRLRRFCFHMPLSLSEGSSSCGVRSFFSIAPLCISMEDV